MKPDNHHHETIKYLGIGKVEYPNVAEGETPFAVAVREAARTYRQDAGAPSANEIMCDHVQGSGILFRQQPADVRARFTHIAKVYGLIA